MVTLGYSEQLYENGLMLLQSHRTDRASFFAQHAESACFKDLMVVGVP